MIEPGGVHGGDREVLAVGRLESGEIGGDVQAIHAPSGPKIQDHDLAGAIRSGPGAGDGASWPGLVQWRRLGRRTG
jgi:hypothetical protein